MGFRAIKLQKMRDAAGIYHLGMISAEWTENNLKKKSLEIPPEEEPEDEVWAKHGTMSMQSTWIRSG